jgi:hypothetical protein
VHQAVQTHRSSWRSTELNSSQGEGHHSTGRQRNQCVQRACLSWIVPRALPISTILPRARTSVAGRLQSHGRKRLHSATA